MRYLLLLALALLEGDALCRSLSDTSRYTKLQWDTNRRLRAPSYLGQEKDDKRDRNSVAVDARDAADFIWNIRYKRQTERTSKKKKILKAAKKYGTKLKPHLKKHGPKIVKKLKNRKKGVRGGYPGGGSLGHYGPATRMRAPAKKKSFGFPAGAVIWVIFLIALVVIAGVVVFILYQKGIICARSSE